MHWYCGLWEGSGHLPVMLLLPVFFFAKRALAHIVIGDEEVQSKYLMGTIDWPNVRAMDGSLVV